MNQMYGFEGEVKAKYNEALSRLFTDTFNYLPLAHLLRLGANGSERVLVMHGGLFSDDDVTLKQLVEIDRVHQPPEAGLMCEILWSDPQFSNGALLGLSLLSPACNLQYCTLNVLLTEAIAAMTHCVLFVLNCRALAVEARRRLPVRAGRDEALLRAERPALHRAQPRGEGGGLRGGARRQVHHCVLRAQLLVRPIHSAHSTL